MAKLHSSQITGTYLKRHSCDFSKSKAAARVRLRQVLQIFLHYVIVVKLILHSDSEKTIKLCGIFIGLNITLDLPVHVIIPMQCVRLKSVT